MASNKKRSSNKGPGSDFGSSWNVKPAANRGRTSSQRAVSQAASGVGRMVAQNLKGTVRTSVSVGKTVFGAAPKVAKTVLDPMNYVRRGVDPMRFVPKTKGSTKRK